jgi:hypothetical protein
VTRKGISQFTLSQVIAECLLATRAARCSPHTLGDYNNTYRKLQSFLPEDPVFAKIDQKQVLALLDDLSTPRSPNDIAR